MTRSTLVALRGSLAFLVATLAAPSAMAADLTVLCAGAMKPAISALLANRSPSLPTVDATYATAGAIREKLAKGERFDLVIAPGDVVYDLMKTNQIDVATRRALGETEIGIAIRTGAPVPDIRTAEALKATLLAARRIVIVDPAKGTSGRLLEAIFKDMHIDDALRDKLIKVDGGTVTEAVARGEADIGFQQVAEILVVKGVTLVGTLPGELKRLTRYDLAVTSGSAKKPAALALATDLSTPAAHVVIEKSGFMPAR